jgi:hypothetical protein
VKVCDRCGRILTDEDVKSLEKLKEKGLKRDAGVRLRKAVIALIKTYAQSKGVSTEDWDRGKLESFITANVEEKHQHLFRDLLDKTQIFYDDVCLDDKTFEERWKVAVKLFKEVEALVEREADES